MLYIDTEDYPVNDADVRERLEKFVNDSQLPEVNTLIDILESCGIHVEKGWHGYGNKYIIPTAIDVEEQNDWAYEMYMDSLGECDNDY